MLPSNVVLCLLEPKYVCPDINAEIETWLESAVVVDIGSSDPKTKPKLTVPRRLRFAAMSGDVSNYSLHFAALSQKWGVGVGWVITGGSD